jgi:crotonobetainyl-CoA:carnitine CoA-transferase CaiB-like acyl-CoA transferase
MTPGQPQVFEGLRVLDLSSEVAGPYCAKVFGDYGADVIKVEPQGGETGRSLEPFFDSTSIDSPERSALFAFLNLNKRGTVIDLETAGGRDVFVDLVRASDVVIESFKPGYLERLGIDFNRLEAKKPGLVMTSITPYGQTYPWSEREGNDLTANALGMWAEINQVEGRPPLKSAGYTASFVGGIAAYVGTVAAIRGRDVQGVGQQVDVSIVEAISALLSPMFYGAQSQGPRRWRGADRLTRVRDGYMSLTLGLTRFLDQACLELGLPDVEEARQMWETGQRAELMLRVGEAASSRDKYELFFKLLELQCPAGIALTTEDLFTDPHLRDRGFWVGVEQPGVGTVEMPATSFLMSLTPFAVTRPAPSLAQHTDEVLTDCLGYDKERIMNLRRDGALA